MSQKPFYCKCFKVAQDKCAMKIGVDAILLGAWADCKNALNVLDIGTGTGIIALQIAQRNSLAKITALEIEENAYEQAKENFTESCWSNRLSIKNIDFSNYLINIKYDLIISNPPYFKNNSSTTSRNIARNQSSLSFNELLSKTCEMLSSNGKASFIIPFESELEFVEIAQRNKLFPNRITRVKGNSNNKIKRSLLEFSFYEKSIEYTNLTIEKSRHQYTKDYINLVKDFYLDM